MKCTEWLFQLSFLSLICISLAQLHEPMSIDDFREGKLICNGSAPVITYLKNMTGAHWPDCSFQIPWHSDVYDTSSWDPAFINKLRHGQFVCHGDSLMRSFSSALARHLETKFEDFNTSVVQMSPYDKEKCDAKTIAAIKKDKTIAFVYGSPFAHYPEEHQHVTLRDLFPNSKNPYSKPFSSAARAFFDFTYKYIRPYCAAAKKKGVPVFYREYSPCHFSSVTGDYDGGTKNHWPCVGHPSKARKITPLYGHQQRALVHLEREVVHKLRKEGYDITILPMFDISFRMFSEHHGWKGPKHQWDCRHYHGQVYRYWADIFLNQLYYIHREPARINDIAIEIDTNVAFDLLNFSEEWYPN